VPVAATANRIDLQFLAVENSVAKFRSKDELTGFCLAFKLGHIRVEDLVPSSFESRPLAFLFRSGWSNAISNIELLVKRR
jgi:hypothetical protein